MKDLTQGNIYKNFLIFAVPSVFTTIIGLARQIIDTSIAGKFLSEKGLASVGAMSATLTLLSSFLWGAATGFAVFIAKVFGSKEYRKLKNDILSGMILFIACAATLCLTAFIFRDFLYDFMRVAPSIRKDTNIHFSISVISLILGNLSTFLTLIMHSLGVTSFPFFVSLISAVASISCSISLIKKWGVAAISVSAFLANVITCILFLIYLFNSFKKLGIKERFTFNKNVLKESKRYFLPNSFQQVAMYLVTALLSPFINGISASATAAYTVAQRVYNINANIYQASTKTVSNFCAQSIGAGKLDKIHKGLFVGLIQSFLFLLFPLSLTVFFPKELCLMFFPKNFAGESLELAIFFCRAFMPFVVFNLINNLFHGFLRGTGAMTTLFISTMLGSLSNLGFSYLFGYFFNLGMKGMFLGWSLSWIFEAIFIFIIYLIKYRNLKLLSAAISRRENK